MGTRKSRHNKGRKTDKHHGICGVICADCFEQFFMQESKVKRDRSYFCDKCANHHAAESSHREQKSA